MRYRDATRPTHFWLWVCDRFDFIVAVVSLVGLVLQLVSSDFHVIALIRPLRVLRSVALSVLFVLVLVLSLNYIRILVD